MRAKNQNDANTNRRSLLVHPLPFPVSGLSPKIVSLDALARIVETLKADGLTVVFTNGCFDLLHVGHVRYLAAARAQGDRLIVGLNSDGSVRGIKGEHRPLTPEAQRAEVLAALACVDYVTVFADPDPLRVIHRLEPDVLVKGDDWPEERIIGADAVRACGGTLVRIPAVPGASTTAIIDRILETHRS
jgi:rfaE bifunctional protein nucleotidyltransferase chain/domain